MTVLIDHLATTELRDDALPVALMPEAVEQLAWYEEQLRTLPSDRKAIAEDEKSRLIDTLMGERPGDTLINEITYLSQLYDGRAVDQEFDDGSTLRSWGTRHKNLQYLNIRYYVQQHADGTIDYRVMMLDKSGRTFYEIDDTGTVDVTVLPFTKHAHDFAPYRPRQLGEEAATDAMKALFGASMMSASMVKERIELGTRGEADQSALSLLSDGPLEDQLYIANSDRAVEYVFNQFTTNRPIPAELLRIPPQTVAA